MIEKSWNEDEKKAQTKLKVSMRILWLYKICLITYFFKVFKSVGSMTFYIRFWICDLFIYNLNNYNKIIYIIYKYTRYQIFKYSFLSHLTPDDFPTKIFF